MKSAALANGSSQGTSGREFHSGFTHLQERGNHLGRTTAGAYRGKDFIFVGKLAPVFPNRRSLHSPKSFRSLIVCAPFVDPPREKNVTWLEPRLVAQIAFRNGQRTKSCASQSFWVCATTKGQANRYCQKNYKPRPLVAVFSLSGYDRRLRFGAR